MGEPVMRQGTWWQENEPGKWLEWSAVEKTWKHASSPPPPPDPRETLTSAETLGTTSWSGVEIERFKADVEVFKVVSEHFRNDLRMFWQHLALFTALEGGLVSVFAAAARDPNSTWKGYTLVVLALAGLVLAVFWTVVLHKRKNLIDTWRGHTITLDRAVDRHLIYAHVEPAVRESRWGGPTAFSARLPWAFIAGWLILAAGTIPFSGGFLPCP